MISFLTTHVISQIDKLLRNIYSSNNYTGFIWFTKPIIEDNIIINRINLQSPFRLEEVMPTSWYAIKPKTIMEIYKRLKNNEVYIKVKMGSYYIKIKPSNIKDNKYGEVIK